MTSHNNRLKVVLFAGGRGAGTLIAALSKHPQIDLSVLVNAYDDGLSTGRVRDFIPGMLGPSDLRKNISNLLSSEDKSQLALKNFLEYRLDVQCTFEEGFSLFRNFERENFDKITNTDLATLFLNTNYKVSFFLRECFSYFNNYVDERAKDGVKFDFQDCSVGNVILAGAFLKNGKDFNKCLRDFQNVLGMAGRVYNVTDGENLVLVAMKNDGSYLSREAEIVSPQNKSKLKDIYLLKKYLSAEEEQILKTLTLEDKFNYLSQKEIFPNLNPELKDVLSSADLIIYGPGTQHSSLFPSYYTKGLGEAIAENKNAEKIFISNILKDNEIQTETANSLTEKLFFYLNQKGKTSLSPNDFAKQFFIQYSDPSLSNHGDYVAFDLSNFPFPKERVILTNSEDSPGKHSGGRVVDELVNIVNANLMKKVKSFPHTVSIIVPCLNEERTVKKVLHDLCLLDFRRFDLGKEIIFVDGGSTDASVEIARTEKHVRVIQSPARKGRGAALREGIKAATGNFIIFFPSDGEYQVQDLYSMVQMLLESEFKAVFGSRAYRCVDPRMQAREIYKGHGFLYFFSMYGGWLLSALCLLLYNRYVSDTLTSLKAFDARILKNLTLTSNGVDLDLEIIAKLSLQRVFIVEIPVKYQPRKMEEGKKITLLDGIKSILRLFFSRKSSFEGSTYAKAIDHHPSI